MQEQQQSPAFNFFKQGSKKTLFEILTGSISFPQRPFIQQDLNVDLVIRMKVPEQGYCHKSKQILIDSFLKNTDEELVSVYNMALEYITYLSEGQGNFDRDQQMMIRMMVSLQKTQKQKKKSYYDRQLDQNQFITNCFEEFNGEIDLFTLFYNTVIYVLQKKCGFKVRSFIAYSINKATQKKEKVINILLSQTDQNLLLVSTKIRMKKKIDMTDIDFHLNAPTDRRGRPLKYNSQLSAPQQNAQSNQQINQLKKQLDYKVKGPSRWLNIKHNNLKKLIVEEAEITQEEIEKYKVYMEEYIQEAERIINQQSQMGINLEEKKYLYKLNRGKLNQGVLNRLYKKKMRKRIFQMTINLNKKHGYQNHIYDDSYFEFRLPSKHKAFFDKLDHLLRYEPTVISSNRQLALFSKMERIKMAYFTLGQFFKVHSFGSFGMDLFTLHDDFERYGFIDQEENSQKPKIIDSQKLIPLNQSWNIFLPMATSIGKLRHYMGQNFTIQSMAKINLITYFLFIAPISIITELLKTYTFTDSTDLYKFSFIQLGVIVICLTLFIEGWKVKESKFFRNYAEQYNQKQFRDQYNGPFGRNYVTDQPNQFIDINANSNSFVKIWKAFVGILVLLSILVLQGVFFWQMRLEIVSLYTNFPSISFKYLSISHVIFYGVYFIGNQIFYNLIFKRLSKILVKWQNYPTLQQSENKDSYYRYFFTFGVQIMGPIFLYLVQPFQGVSCYAAECIQQFQLYTYSRYFLVFFMVFFKYFKFMFQYCKGEFKDIMKQRKQEEKHTVFQQKMQALLVNIDQQYKKEDIQTDLRDEALAMFYYVVFTIHFPFCSIFTLALLYVNYVFDRIEIFKNKRRPIPSFGKITKFSEIFSVILHASILFNCWAICFTFQFLQYDLKSIIETFVLTITLDNVLTLKLLVSVALFIVYEVIASILKKLISGIDFSALDFRKKTMYKKYLFSFFQKQLMNKINPVIPIRTIMRTFSHQFVAEQKKNKWKFFEAFKKKGDQHLKKLTMMQLKLKTNDTQLVEPQGQQSLSRLKQ